MAINHAEKMKELQRKTLEAGDHTYKVKSNYVKASKNNEEALSALAALHGSIPEGHRNTTMTRLAGVLRKQGMDEYLMSHLLLCVNDSRRIGLPEQEVRNIARSISQYTPSQIENADKIQPLRGLVPYKDCVAETLHFMERVRTGKEKLVVTGIDWFDNAFGGILGGELITIGARASVGKSAFGMQIAFGAAMQDIPVAYFSLEMSRVSLAARRSFKNTGITFGEYLRGKGKTMTKEQAAKFQSNAAIDACIPLYISETPCQTISRMREELLSVNNDFAPGAIVVDHLHLMGSDDPNSTNYHKITKTTSDLKSLALELKIPVFVLAQLNRSSDKEERKPSDFDLRDSGSIEQDSDRVVLLHRPRRNDEKWMSSPFDPAIAIIAKNRNMGTSDVKCWFEKHLMDFSSREDHANYSDDNWETPKRKSSNSTPDDF